MKQTEQQQSSVKWLAEEFDKIEKEFNNDSIEYSDVKTRAIIIAEYIQRYKDRGNNDSFVDLLNKNWDNWMDEMDNQEGCHKVKIESGQYLTDVID